jgi:hypothetical protein
MDTFFATKKGGKIFPGTHMLPIVCDDKGFVYAVPMKWKDEVLLALKQFAKEIGAPDAFVADMSGEQMSKEVTAFCNEIGSTLRALEEGTPWANKAELYIGLLKEAVRKDMKEQDSPMVLWDYCIERRARIHNLTAKYNFKLHGPNRHTLERKETYPAFVNLDGTSGATIANTLPPFPTNRKSWGECLDQQGEKAMKCSNG